MDVEKQNRQKLNGSEEMTVRPIEGTPFTVHKTEKGYILAIGNIMASKEVFENTESAEARVLNTDWEVISNVICCYIENWNKIKKN